jgi:hypothetical protein
MAPAPERLRGLFFGLQPEQEHPMSEHFHHDPVAEPECHETGDGGPDSSPREELDWKGVLERVREEFRTGKALDGVQRTFR